MKSWMLGLITLGAVLAAAPAAVVAAGEDRDEGAREYFTDLEVVDQNGEKLRFYSDVLKDRVVLINVIFTNCQDACPLITQVIKQTRGQLAEAVRDEVWFVSISTDPERDDPAALKAFAEKQGVDDSRWLFLTGPKENIEHILKKIRRYNPDINAHSTQMLAGTTRERHEWLPVPPGIPPEAIAALLRGLAEPRPELTATPEEHSG
jgi:cytochrome oxidase Cu insertion factor (SCO1/SenC/PrrC family)